MRVKFLAQGNNGGPLMGLELTTDKYPPITSQTRYPLRNDASQFKKKNADTTLLFSHMLSLLFPPISMEVLTNKTKTEQREMKKNFTVRKTMNKRQELITNHEMPHAHFHTYTWISISWRQPMHQCMNILRCTLKRISNWPPSFCYVFGTVFGEKYK